MSLLNRAFAKLMNETITWKKRGSYSDSTWATDVSWTEQTIECVIAPITVAEILSKPEGFELVGHFRFYTKPDYSISAGDRVVYNNTEFEVLNVNKVQLFNQVFLLEVICGRI